MVVSFLLKCPASDYLHAQLQTRILSEFIHPPWYPLFRLAEGNSMPTKQGSSRRQLLIQAGKSAVAASLASLTGCFPKAGGEWPADVTEPSCTAETANPTNDVPAAVADVFREDCVLLKTNSDGISVLEPQAEVVQQMLDQALSTLAGGAENPWPVLLPTYQDGMRIGLKVNCLNVRLPTSPALVRAIINSLLRNLSIAPTNIVVWDRRLDELKNTGKYSPEDLQGAQLLGTVTDADNPAGPGYSSTFCGSVEGSAPRLSRILTHLTDLTINCPVLKTHAVSGVTAGLKNIYGIIDNPGSYHDNLVTALPALYQLPPIKNHIKLTIVDALRAVTLGGTDSPPDSTPKHIFVGNDPLATDQYAIDLVNELRATRNKPAITGTILGWVDNAHQLGVGSKTYALAKL
jgi:uncharacterized protein (DUF362 family)